MIQTLTRRFARSSNSGASRRGGGVETDLAVEEVGRKLGYVDAGYFVKSFRRTHGTTPLGWRRAGRP
jgi:AraC-like DNA-binding protein